MYNILPFYETKTKAQIQAFFDKVHKEMEQKEAHNEITNNNKGMA